MTVVFHFVSFFNSINSMQGLIISLCFTCTLIDDPGPGGSEASRNFFVVLNKFWFTLIQSLSQGYYFKKDRFT